MMTNSANFSLRLHQALRLLLLLIVAATALAHPLCLPDAKLGSILDSIHSPRLRSQIQPWLSCGFSPLILKEAVLLTLAICALFAFTWIKVRGQLLQTEKSAFTGGWRGLLRKPQSWAVAWLVYSAMTVFVRSPVVQQSLAAWISMAAGLAAALLLMALPGARGFKVKFMLMVIGCGAVLAGVALLQHLGMADWMPQSADPRNRMSSLIGHNTGLSSWLMFPLSYCIYFATVNRHLWARGAAWLLATLMVLVIIAAESRAVWVLGLGILLFLPWKMHRVAGRKLPRTGLLGTLTLTVILIFALSFSPQTNRLARLPVSLAERLSGHVFNLDQLRRETRLRILMVSASELVPRAPLFGSGFGSFSWVYPKAQGDYFRANPDSRLGTTTKRTDLAHNDFLQVLVETGLIGLLLVLGGIGALLRSALAAREALTTPWDRAQWWALVVPSLCVMAHAFVDFPMHVAPIAVITLFSVGLAQAAVGKVRSQEAQENLMSSNTPQSTAVPRFAAKKSTGVALAITMVIFCWVPWIWTALAGRVLLSDIYLNDGREWLQLYYNSRGQTLDHKFAMLERARRAFREAVVVDVFNGEAYEAQATAYVNRASLAVQTLQEKSQDLQASQTLALKSLVQRDTQAASSVIANQLANGGLRYHFTYYLLARAWRMQWELEKGKVAPADSLAYKKGVAALQMAVDYNPADAVALRELADMLLENPKTSADGHRLLGRLFIIDPFSARELIILPAVEIASEGDVLSARAMLASVMEQYPKEPSVLAARGWLAYYEAVWPPRALDNIDKETEYLAWRKEHLAPARAAVSALPDRAPFDEDKRRLQMLFAGASGDLSQAHTLAKKRVDVASFDMEALAVYNWTQQKLYGGGVRGSENVEYYKESAFLAAGFMAPREQCLLWAGQVYSRGGKLSMACARRIAQFCAANGWWQILEKGLPTILEEYPGDQMLQDISTEAKNNL